MKYKGSIRPKLPQVGTTIFAVMNQLANEQDAVNLSQGFPDFPVSEKLISLVNQYMKKGFNQYAPMQGIQALREEICQKVEKLYSAVYHPEREINITAGATQAIYTAITSVIHPGDEVILFAPAYDSYAPTVKINGGKPIFSYLKPPRYSPNWTEVERLLTPQTRLIIVNTPHNPAGGIFTAEDMLKLECLIRGKDILVLSDEVYEHIVFDGRRHESVLRFPNLRERSFVVFSFGKTLHSTGWKMGYCLAPENLMREFRSVHQFLVYSCNTPVQFAIADFLGREENYLGIGEMYQRKRDLFLQLIRDSRFDFTPTGGSYFQLLGYRSISDQKDTEFAVRMTKEHKVASIPVSAFYPDGKDDKMLRFCFAKRNETLEKAAEILCKI